MAGFLANPTIRTVFEGLDQSYYRAWKDSTTPTAREELYARVAAFDDLNAALQGIVSSGERATVERELRERENDQI